MTTRSVTTIIVLLISYPMVQQDVDIMTNGGVADPDGRLQTRQLSDCRDVYIAADIFLIVNRTSSNSRPQIDHVTLPVHHH